DEGAEPKIISAKKTGHKVAVIGAGPAGLAAAYYLQLRGIQVTLFDKALKAGGQLRTEISEEILPREVLDKEIELILKTGVEFFGEKTIDNEAFAKMQNSFDAVVV